MKFIELFFIAIGLATDAFAVAVCKGISNKIIKNCFKVAIYFGFFQALMPIFGYLVGFSISKFVFKIDHIIVFFLLVVIGANMIYDTFCNKENEYDKYFDFVSLVVPALATSIDAFSVGITFALTKTNIIFSCLFIGIVTFVLSFVGMYFGGRFLYNYKKKAKVIGGIVLILMGINLLLKHI